MSKATKAERFLKKPAGILAGITLSQLIREGTPLIAGWLTAFMDMRTMVNFYDALSYLLNLACAEMMAFYRIPITETLETPWGGVSISSRPDISG